MTTKHTPGPWHAPHFADDTSTCNCRSVVSEYVAGAVCTIEVDNGLRISEGGNDAPPLEQAKANARLIAAAPDLLDALKQIVPLVVNRILEPDSDQGVKDIILAAYDAVAKAEGRS